MGLYLVLKYYVVPISCFVKMMTAQFPSCPQRHLTAHRLSFSVTCYQHCVSINQRLAKILIQTDRQTDGTGDDNKNVLTTSGMT